MLKHRLISASVLMIAVVFALFFLSFVKLAIISLIVCFFAAKEWGNLSNLTSSFSDRILQILLYLLLAMSFFLCVDSQYINRKILMNFLEITLGWWILALFLVLFYPTSGIIWRYSKTMRFLFGSLTIVPFFWGILILQSYNDSENYNAGRLWLFYIMILVWGVDIGAYMFGQLFGKHLLAPKISPGKTWEGLFGGFILSLFLSFLYNVIFDLSISLPILLCFSIITSLSAVLGDLTESMFKREAGIKDSSQLIPGHGGILDRIDSLTAAVPIFTYFLFLLNKI